MKKILTAALVLLLLAAVLFAGCGLTELVRFPFFGNTIIFSPFTPDALREPDFVDFRVSRFHYATLTHPQRQAYQQIYNNVFSFPEKIQIPRIGEDELREVLLAVRYDNPILFFLDSTYTYSLGANKSYVFPEYTVPAKTARAQTTALLQRARTLAETAATAETLFDRELVIHDGICGGCRYENGANADNAYGALVEGRAVCEGYSLAAKLVFDLTGIPAFTVRGTAAEPGETPVKHMWNAVKPDADWYFLDCTWDDPVLADGGEYVRHAYFNVDAETLDRTHGDYTLPADIVCDGEASQYFRKKKLFCTASNWEAVIREAVSDAADGTAAEFRFENEALLSEVTARLFTDGGLAQMIPAELENCRWAAQEDALTLQIRFVGAQRNE